MSTKSDRGNSFSVSATHATAAVASKAAAASTKHFITDIAVSSDKAGSICLVKQGTTTLWQMQVGASFYSQKFEIPLEAAVNALVSVEIDGTSACKANISGFSLPAVS
jgi:hypothetical protein